jgi:hypothetical protein
MVWLWEEYGYDWSYDVDNYVTEFMHTHYPGAAAVALLCDDKTNELSLRFDFMTEEDMTLWLLTYT